MGVEYSLYIVLLSRAYIPRNGQCISWIDTVLCHEEESMRLKLKDRSWAAVIDLAWRLQALAEKRAGGPLDCRTVELMYGPAVAETLIRHHGQAVSKLMPTTQDIECAYRQSGRKEPQFSEHILSADNLAEKFATISGDPYVAIGPKLSVRAQIICHLAHTLELVARQKFQQAFIWDERRRQRVFNDDEIASWNALESQLGMGILASVWSAKQIVRDVTPDEFATALLRKYGIPVLVEGVKVYTCHWCGTGPCSCGGGKAPTRQVTYDEARKNLHRGPLDTQLCMYYAYGWANVARGGVGYGPLRALIEAATEKGAVLVESSSITDLERRLGPLLLRDQRHFVEIFSRYEMLGWEEKARKALLSELADAVHWQFLYGPALLDHVSGVYTALKRIAVYCGAELEIPEVQGE
ncbi:hypothetical protein A3B35_01445 [Candidatus Kaiserbacteria bacterium RIFCSPLOWO2_01_FULL_54_24]|uniref:Uncharacterized protein n=1 Tax=Candidatus Kaiserbacteria bacterium RIFCSPLOWO2_01_FULL_54_24 TaxID=1798515 RepID=A0A1F6EVU5_9BACT|nr:MAG: hypothetical protein A3B35_01445 [Candidatus Kaiserbacteria bacterium RIFCSPLOWO2_01_FULL_54_24]